MDLSEHIQYWLKSSEKEFSLWLRSHLEPLPYCPEDFTMEDPFIKRVVETGVSLI